MRSKKNISSSRFLEKQIDLFFEKLNLIPHQTIILGLSGGPDSVALLNLLAQKQAQFKYNLIAAHLDHQWRENSKQDLLFCQELCRKLNLKLIYEQASNLDLKPILNGSKEDLGRQLRRYFFNKISQIYQAKYIILAHHLDDQIETFMIRLIRGSSLTGLSCMQEQAEIYLRPLLNISKQEILDYLHLNNLNYIQDSTNLSPDFLRNRIRFLMPELEKIDPRFKSNFNQTLNQIKIANNFILDLSQDTLKQVSLKQESKIINLNLFKQLKPFLQNQVILAWLYYNQVNFTQTKNFILEILKFFNSKHGGSHQINPSWLITKKQNLVEIKILANPNHPTNSRCVPSSCTNLYGSPREPVQ